MSKDTILEGRILPPLIKFALPLMLSLFLQALYGAVDLIVVGHFSTTANSSAVATGSQLMNGVTGIIVGLTTGVTVLIGQYIGAKNNKMASAITAGMTKILIVLSLFLFVVLMFFTKELLAVLRLPEKALASGLSYVKICAAGILFISAYNAISGIFRGVGNSKMPLVFIFIACIINIFGDLILVGGLKMGAAGAALATVLAQAVSVIFSLAYIKKGGLPFRINKESFKTKGSVNKILKIGVPIALQDFLTRVSFLILTAILNSLGLVASVSVGISEKLFSFLSIVSISFMSALSAFVAQNIGASNHKRAMKSLEVATLLSFGFGVLTFSAAYFFPVALVSIFEKNPEVIKTAAGYQKVCSFEHLMISIQFCLLGYFNGISKTTFVMIQGLVTAFLVRIPLSYYLCQVSNGDLAKIGLAVPLSALFSLVLCLVYFIYIKIKSEKSLK